MAFTATGMRGNDVADASTALVPTCRCYKEFLESPYYRKYQVDMLTAGRVGLLDILYNDNMMFYFMEVSCLYKLV